MALIYTYDPNTYVVAGADITSAPVRQCLIEIKNKFAGAIATADLNDDIVTADKLSADVEAHVKAPLEITQLDGNAATSVTTGGTYYDVSGLSVEITTTVANTVILLSLSGTIVSTAAGSSSYYKIIEDDTPADVEPIIRDQVDPDARHPIAIYTKYTAATAGTYTFQVQVTSDASSQTVTIHDGAILMARAVPPEAS